MSRNVSLDDQSDDGELQDSPLEPKDKPEEKTVIFMVSEEEGEKVVSSNAKPPRDRPEKRAKERSGRTERFRDERHSYKEKHHRKKSGRVDKDKNQHQRDKERNYREKQHLEQGNYDGSREKAEFHFRSRRHKTDQDKGEEMLTEEERAEQEQRRERLFQAERERAILKEQSRVERELRRDLKRAIKRKRKADMLMKRRVKEEIPTVTLSDSPDADTAKVYFHKDPSSDRSPETVAPSRSDQTRPTFGSAVDGSPSSPRSPRRSRTRSGSRTGSASESPGLRDRSRSRTPRSLDGDEEMEAGGNDGDDDEDDEEPKLKLDDSLPVYYPAVQGCRSVEEFQCLNRIEEGTYGVVYRARDKRTEDIVALKRLKMEREKEGFPITSLREINTLLKGQHPNMVTVREIVVGNNMDKIFIVMDYVEHDLKSLMETMRHKKQRFMPGEIKCLLRQLLLAVAHLHDNWILHRDLKTSNLLLSHKGILKVGDFGLAREYGSPLKAYTPGVVTAWYRAPELLLCAKEYSTPIDLWSVGCIFAELVLMNPLFPGKSEVDQLNRIFKDLGTPSEAIWPGFNQLPAVQKMKFNDYPVSNLRGKFNTLSEAGLGLLLKFLTYDPARRTTAEAAMTHAYYNEPPVAIDPAMFPTWPAKSEVGLTRALASSPRPPSGGGEYKKLSSDVDEDGFRIGTGVDKRREGAGFSLKF